MADKPKRTAESTAVATLKRMGYAWKGGVWWAPPIGFRGPRMVRDPDGEDASRGETILGVEFRTNRHLPPGVVVMSTPLAGQSFFRGERVPPKGSVVIIDHVGNVPEAEADGKLCGTCYCMAPPDAEACNYCGARWEPAA